MNKKDSTRLIEIKNLVLMISITLFIGIFLLIFYITRTKNQYIIYKRILTHQYILLHLILAYQNHNS